MAHKYALLIGNSEYQDPSLAQLKAPDADVYSLAKILKDSSIGGFDEVTTCVNQFATDVSVEIAKFFAEKKPDDLSLLYFSGHGILDKNGRLYLAVKNTQHNLLSATGISTAFITDELDNCRSRRQVLILDCCHSGAFARGKKSQTGAKAITHATFEGTGGYGRVVLTATDSTQYALEGDQVIGNAEHSLFTHFLIEGLRTGVADKDHKGKITLDDLYDYIHEQVRSQTPNQTPSKWVYKQQGDIVIARSHYLPDKPAELPLELRQAIDNTLASVRAGAVHQLGELIQGTNRGLSLAAYQELERIAEEDDSRKVSSTAAEILSRHESPIAIAKIANPSPIYLPDLLSKYTTGGWNGSNWLPCHFLKTGEKPEQFVQSLLGIYELGSKPEPSVFYIDLDPEHEGHLLVFGSSGSGKTTLLQTYITSLALTKPPNEAYIYIMDFGVRSKSKLRALESLPHVGAIITRFETERIIRLSQFIHDEVLRRNDLFKQKGVYTWSDYNAATESNHQIPALFLFIDGFREFRSAFQEDVNVWNPIFTPINNDLDAGVYITIATPRSVDIPESVFSTMRDRITFDQADSNEYMQIIGRLADSRTKRLISKPLPPGYGLVSENQPRVFQAALPVVGKTDHEQTENLSNLATIMAERWKGKSPKKISVLPTRLYSPLDKQFNKDGYFIEMGIEFIKLESVGLSLEKDGPGFLITSGSSKSGKTTLLHNWILRLTRSFSEKDIQFLFIDFHSRTMLPFQKLPPNYIFDYVGRLQDFSDSLEKLRTNIQKRTQEVEQAYENDPGNFKIMDIIGRHPRVFVIIDDYPKFYMRITDDNHRQQTGSGSKLNQLLSCMLQGEEVGINFAVAGNTSELPNAFEDPFLARIRKYGCGILFSGITGLDEHYNQTRRPQDQPTPAAGLPPGRGYLVKHGKAQLMQSSIFWEKQQANDEIIQQIKSLHNI